MSFGVTITIVFALMVFGGIVCTWITSRRHVLPADPDGLSQTRQVELLTSENERLNSQVGRLEQRIRVLERIATDPSERTARAIENL